MMLSEMRGNTNSAVIAGIISAEPELSHSIYGEDFYSFFIETPRLSGTVDVLPVTAPRSALPAEAVAGSPIAVEGQLRSYNRMVDGASRLDLRLFARRVAVCTEMRFENSVSLEGYICKIPVYRATPFGREITDLLLAVNRQHNKSDYIPSIAWGRNARAVRELAVGSRISISGRMQSREYEKCLETGEKLRRTTYEVSIAELTIE